MAPMRTLAVILLAIGALALAYGGFTYTRQTHEMKVGPVEMSVNEHEHVNVPLWAGFAILGAGALLLLAPAKT